MIEWRSERWYLRAEEVDELLGEAIALERHHWPAQEQRVQAEVDGERDHVAGVHHQLGKKRRPKRRQRRYKQSPRRAATQAYHAREVMVVQFGKEVECIVYFILILVHCKSSTTSE
jgi:hypothetical protein